MPLRRLLVLPVVAAALFATVASPAAPAAAADLAGSVTSTQTAPGGAAGTTRTVELPGGRTYRLFVPTTPSANPGLAVVLHGKGGDATGMESYTNADVAAGRGGNYVAYGNGVDRSWNAGTCCAPSRDAGTDDIAYLDALLDDALARTRVPEGRVVMAGFSNGAMMSYTYTCARPGRVSTMLAIGGTAVAECTRTAPVSVFAVHGALDVPVPWGGTKTSSLVLGGIMPAVPSVLGGVAALDGCSGWVKDRTPLGVDRWTAQACPTGTNVVGLLSPTMGHMWPTGATHKSLYGMDATALMWSVAGDRWSR